MPDEFDSDAGTPENRLAISRKAVSCLALSGIVELFGGGEVAHHQRDAVIAGIDARDDALRLGRASGRAGSCRCRCGWRRRPDQPERRQNTSHSASSLRSPITGLQSILA